MEIVPFDHVLRASEDPGYLFDVIFKRKRGIKQVLGIFYHFKQFCFAWNAGVPDELQGAEREGAMLDDEGRTKIDVNPLT